MKRYHTPEEYFFRCMFPRGRLLSRLEDDLTIFASLFVSCANRPKKDFESEFDEEYGKLHDLGDKTIRNHRTEMNRLWGMTIVDEQGFVRPSARTLALIETQDFRLFFKDFCNKFQYPNCINKPQETIAQSENGVRFKPAQFVLKLMKKGVEAHGAGFSVSGPEISNLIFNDLRVTARGETPDQALQRLIVLRKERHKFEGGSFHAQHGREFLDYMVLAGLLAHDRGTGGFRLSTGEERAIEYIIEDKDFFKFPDDYADSLEIRKSTQKKWDAWFGELTTQERTELITPDEVFSGLVAVEGEEQPPARGGLAGPTEEALKEIGDLGELIALKYERGMIGRVRPDKVALVRIVSNDTSLGFDIQSLEFDDITKRKLIEVKTTKRTYSPGTEVLTFFPMSNNEWEAATHYGDSYYIYRVFLTTQEVRIFVVRNPAEQKKRKALLLEPLVYRVILRKEAGKFINIGATKTTGGSAI